MNASPLQSKIQKAREALRAVPRCQQMAARGKGEGQAQNILLPARRVPGNVACRVVGTPDLRTPRGAVPGPSKGAGT